MSVPRSDEKLLNSGHMQQFCVLMTFNDALPVLSTKNDGHCHHSCMGVFPDPQSNNIEGLARETSPVNKYSHFKSDSFLTRSIEVQHHLVASGPLRSRMSLLRSQE